LIVLLPPSRSNSCSWRTRRSFGWSSGGDVAHLVQEQRPAVGELEAAHAPLEGPGEGPALVAEELALEEPGRDRGAVELDERPLLAAGRLVDRAGDQLLAGAGLAPHEDGRVGRRHGLDVLEDLREPAALADDLAEVVVELALQVALLAGQLVLQPLDLEVRERVRDRRRELVGDLEEELEVGRPEGPLAEAARGHGADQRAVHQQRRRGHALDPGLDDLVEARVPEGPQLGLGVGHLGAVGAGGHAGRAALEGAYAPVDPDVPADA